MFDYSQINVVEFLEGLGVKNVRDVGLEVSFSCPFDHSRGDVNPSASMSKVPIERDDGSEYPPTTFYCFGCGKAGNAVTFLAEFEGVSPLIARHLIRERFGMIFKEPEGSIVADIRNKLEKKEKVVESVNDRQQDLDFKLMFDYQERLEHSSEAQDYLKKRGFDRIVCSDFYIGFDWLHRRITIPIFNEIDELIGFKGRSIEERVKPKYLVLGGKDYGFDTYDVSTVVFALNRMSPLNFINRRIHFIITEGELNAIAMHQMGYTNTVGISGQYLSDRQNALIINRCKSATLIFDEEDKAVAAAKKLGNWIAVDIVPPRKLDPADVLLNGSTKKMEEILNTAIKPYLL